MLRPRLVGVLNSHQPASVAAVSFSRPAPLPIYIGEGSRGAVGGWDVRYEDAKRIGDTGEERVADALRILQPTFGFDVIPNILIGTRSKGTAITAQLDHVVVDKFGVLIVETKVRRRAMLRGTSVETKWTACYPGGKNYTFQNPISQNDQHVALLYQLLKQSKPDLELERVRGVVVFVDADVSALDLDSIGKTRVTTSEALGFWFAARQNFVIAPPLSEQEQAALVAAVSGLDRTEDPLFAAAHAAHRSASQSSTAAPQQPVTRRTPKAPVGVPAPVTSARWTRGALIAALGLTAAGVGAWALIQVQAGNVPAWVWGLALLFAAGLIGDESTGRRRRRRKRTAPAPSFGARLTTLMAGLTVVLLVTLSLPWFFSRIFVPVASGGAIMTPSATASTPVSDVPAAQRALKDAAPNIYDALLEKDAPVVTQDVAGVAYEWEYLEKTSKDSVLVKKIRITLDAAGNIIGTRMP